MTQSNSETLVSVSAADLPLHCPTPDGELWDSHPRVFIPVAESGEAKCPYCGTLYRLENHPANANTSD